MVLLMLLPPSLLLLASCWYTKVKENHARCCRKARHDRNKHRFLLPVTTDGHSWHLTPAHHVNLTRDHSSASENGVKEFFTDYEVFSADCTFHASPAYWSRKHMELFSQSNSDYVQEMQFKMNHDFQYLKNCPHVEVVLTRFA
jgi:hypothetical protein